MSPDAAQVVQLMRQQADQLHDMTDEWAAHAVESRAFIAVVAANLEGLIRFVADRYEAERS